MNHRFPPRPHNETDFEKDLMTAMNRLANDATPPIIDARRVRARARRRTTINTGAASLALIVAIAGTAIALSGTSHQPAGPSTTTAAVVSGPFCPNAPASPAPTGHTTRKAEPTPVQQPTGDVTVTVPSVIGLKQAAAAHLLSQAGLCYELHTLTDWHTPAGEVMEVGPRGGTSVPWGSTVNLFISKGKPGD